MNDPASKIAVELSSASSDYYNDGDSSLSDDDFDALREFVESVGVVVSTLMEPDQASPWKVVKHAKPMSSISTVASNVHEWKDLVDAGKVSGQGWASPKLDGLSVQLVYGTDGRLLVASLRGNGMSGEDVTSNVKHCRGVPKELYRDGKTTILSCELVVSSNNLSLLNQHRVNDGLNPYKSRRNAVSLIRSNKASIHHLKLLTVVVLWCDECPNPTTLDAWLNTNLNPGSSKFITVSHTSATPLLAWKIRDHQQQHRDQNPYQLDGVVFRDSSGRLTKLKFESSSKVTVVTGVVEQLGRTGVVTPVCEFDPVSILGATISRASVHNAELVLRSLGGLGKGAVVLVSRRGDVIPHVERVVVSSDEPWVPSGKCPSCGAETLVDGSVSKCSADPGECPGSTVGLMLKFVNEIGVKWASHSVISALVNAGITTPAQLFGMELEWLSSVVMSGGQRIGEARANMILFELARKKEMTLGELLGALGIPGCARSVMEAVASAFPDPDQLARIDVEELSTVVGVGPSRALSIAAFLDLNFNDVVEPLLNVISIKRAVGPLSGMTFCISLGLDSCSRPQMEARIRSAGGAVRSSVTRHTTYLVCNTPSETTGKLTKAYELSVPIIDERSLIEMMKDDFKEQPPNVEDLF